MDRLVNIKFHPQIISEKFTAWLSVPTPFFGYEFAVFDQWFLYPLPKYFVQHKTMLV